MPVRHFSGGSEPQPANVKTSIISTPMHISQTEAIVLHTRDYGESDRLIVFYSEARGKLRGIAKGARRSRKRFVHTFELCSLVDLTYRERKGLIWIEACKLLEPYLALRVEVERWGYAALLAEVILEMVPEADPQTGLFELVRQTLSRLSEDKDPLNILVLFLLRFLDIAGYLPALDQCDVCHRPYTSATDWWWRLNEGTLVCPEHRGVFKQLRLDLGTLMIIQQCRKAPLAKMWRLHLLPSKRRPLLQALVEWIRHQIRKDLKSFRLLEQLKSA